MSAHGLRLDPDGGLLVRLPNWLGDLVATEPAVRALAASFERAGRSERLTLVAPRRLLALFDGRFDAVRRLPAEDGTRAWRGHAGVLLFTGSFRSALDAWRSGATVRVGQARDGRGALLTHAVRPALERGAPAAARTSRARWPRLAPRGVGAVSIELCGLLGVWVPDAHPRLVPGPAARAAVDAEFLRLGLAPDAAPVVVNAGGRPGSAKAPPPALWAAALSAGLGPPPGTDGPGLLLTFGPGEEPAARSLAADLSARGVAVALWGDGAAAPDLATTLALFARASRVVTPDTGPRHLARAVGAPTDVLFGPTDPRHTNEGPAGERWFVGRVPCGPCHSERCPLPSAVALACQREALGAWRSTVLTRWCPTQHPLCEPTDGGPSHPSWTTVGRWGEAAPQDGPGTSE